MENIVGILNVNENTCLKTYPSKYYVTFRYIDGTTKSTTVSGDKILDLCDKFGYLLENRSHFAKYSKSSIPVLTSMTSYFHDYNKGDENKIKTEYKFEDIYKYGTYYNPAVSHYNNNGFVKCDNCDETLSICIGYQDQDLCMVCMDEISKNMQ